MTAQSDRSLIVNADDFGLTPGVNAGIARAHEQGILTSASLMVRPASAADAVRYAERDGDLALGLHADLGEWEYREGRWVQIYEVVDTADLDAIEREVRATRALPGAGGPRPYAHRLASAFPQL